MADAIGQPFMPWQRLVADVAGELDLLTGRPCYRKIGVTVPRQSGKTTLLLAWLLQRAIGWDEFGPQVITFTMQDGGAASKKMLNDWAPILLRYQSEVCLRTITRSNGNVGAHFDNGSHLLVLPSTPDAGHGMTVDLGLTDELFEDKDDRREQSLIPAMATRQFAQNIVTSTAGDDLSEPLNRLMARGRNAVETNSTRGLAYFEWSAGLDEDPDDPATWWGCMPSLGYTQTEDVMEQNRAILADGEFRRAFLNQPTVVGERVIPVSSWEAVNHAEAKPGPGALFSIDVTPDRSHASIAAASGGSVPTTELVEHRPGVGWVVDRAAELSAKWGNAAVIVDSQGPAGAVLDGLVERQVNVQKIGTRELVAACGAFYDRVLENRVRVRRNLALDEAVAGAIKRPVGDAWAWARKHPTVDVSPLVAITLAVWAAAGPRTTNGAFIDPNTYTDEEDEGWKTS